MSKLLESVKNSASFILVWVITFVALYVLAKLIENKLSHNEKKSSRDKKIITYCDVFSFGWRIDVN